MAEAGSAGARPKSGSAPDEMEPGAGHSGPADRLRRWAGRLGRRLARYHAADLAAPLVLLALVWLYTWQLGGNRLLSDDEGGYMYAAWRISLGQRPYCDFLTPQLPGFLLPAGLLFRLTGPDFLAARLMAVLATLGAGLALWAATRRLFGPAVGLVAGVLLVLHPDVFLAGRVFRADPFMLFSAVLGLALFLRAVFPRPGTAGPPQRRWLLAAGLAFGLATVTKLFGPFLMGGCLLWLTWDAWRRGRPWPALAADSLAFLAPALGLVALSLGLVALGGCDVYGSVLGHHLQQGAGLGLVEVVGKGLSFFSTFLRYNQNALLFFVAIAAGLAAWRAADRPALAFACLLPTALVFLVLSRELFARHLNYLLPAATTLFALGALRLAAGWGRVGESGWGRLGAVTGPSAGAETAPSLAARSLSWALVGSLVFTWWLTDRDMAWLREDGTQRLADFIQLVTTPEDWVLADNSEFNFWALRPTSFSAASLSAGAAQSGQINWARIQDELAVADQLPALLFVDRTSVAGVEYAHLRFLHDLPAFEAWRADRYDFAGLFQRSVQRLEVYTPQGRPLPVAGRFNGGPLLLAAAPLVPERAAGEELDFRAAWQAGPEPVDELVTTLRLVDRGGGEWGQADASLMASPERTTDLWVPGELTSHRLALSLPPGTPPGPYRLRLGLYRRGDLRPLEAADASGAVLGASLPGGELQVLAGPALPDRRLPLDQALDSEALAGLRLAGRGALPQGPVLAGTAFEVDLWWQAAGVDQDLALRVTLADPGIGAVAADLVAPLGVPGAPSATWPPGPFSLRQPLRVPVRVDAAGGTYSLSVVLVDAAGQVLDGAAPQLLGQVLVEARDLSELRLRPPVVDRPVAAELGGLAALIGSDLAVSALPGSPLTISLAWQVLASSERPLNVTVQLLDADGRPVAQHDGEPGGGRRPTTGWLPGEYLLDSHDVALPEDLPAGDYAAIAALYDPVTGERLPVSGPDALGDAVRLGTVRVQGR